MSEGKTEIKNFMAVFARNCSVRRITKAEAGEFLDRCHRMGNAAARYRYGIFMEKGRPKVHGEISADLAPAKGTMVAVATFAPTRMHEGMKSAEWVRYASLPGVRVLGGMGKALKTFIGEVRPDDVMTYADTSWSDGDAYRRLGFVEEGRKSFPGGGESMIFRLTVRSD